MRRCARSPSARPPAPCPRRPCRRRRTCRETWPKSAPTTERRALGRSTRARALRLRSRRDHAVVEAEARVAAVAEGLVRGDAAAAQRDAVADLVPLAVGRLDRDAALHEERPAAPERRVLDDADGGFELVLDGLARLVVVDHETAGGAMVRFADDEVADLGR